MSDVSIGKGDAAMTKYSVAEIDGSFAVIADDQAVICVTDQQAADQLIDAMDDGKELGNDHLSAEFGELALPCVNES